MKKKAETTAAVKPTRDDIEKKQLQLFKLREQAQQTVAQCNAQINELERMLKEA